MESSESLFEFIRRYGFVIYLLASFFAFRSPGPSKMLGLGFGLIGAQGLLVRAVVATTGYEGIRGWGPMLDGAYILALILLLVGAYRLQGPGRGARGFFQLPRSHSYLNPSETPMETLVIPRNDTNSYTRAETLRDRLYESIDGICSKDGANVIGYKSAEKSGFIWVRFDYLLPQGRENLSLRASLTITIDRFDFHRFEHLLTVQTTLGTRSKKRDGFIELVDADIRAINAYLSKGGPFPAFRSRRARLISWQLWRPANKVEKLDWDWPVIGFAAGIVLSLFSLAVIPVFGWLLAVALAIALGAFSWQRQTYILTTGKPLHDPRLLIRMDSWQVNIDGLGVGREGVREALLDRLGAATDKGVQIVTERIWYPGVDGKVEREQIVCTFRRAIGYVHVEAYGNDLYLGWDSHVNSGTWVEQTLARGVDHETRKLVLANRVVSGSQAPNEYDITDVNFLTEWLHACVVRVVRLKMEEHKIDQEIDFTIQRESRKEALTEMRPDASPGSGESGPAGRFVSRLRRLK